MSRFVFAAPAILSASLALCLLSLPAAAQGPPSPQGNPQVDYSSFLELATKLQDIREGRRLALKPFLERSASSEAILLDTRSAADFSMGHIAGAINLPFSEFTDVKLAEVLGDDQTRAIYIYCNNNFSDNIRPVVSKRAPLALNIPTFINLHGYGYANVWELADVVSTKEVAWASWEPLASASASGS